VSRQSTGRLGDFLLDIFLPALHNGNGQPFYKEILEKLPNDISNLYASPDRGAGSVTSATNADSPLTLKLCRGLALAVQLVPQAAAI
jgi:hypothetical protein